MDAQKALLATDAPGGLDDLNSHLQRGWRVASVAPMGGGGQTEGFAALVILDPPPAATVLDEIAEEMEEVLGDGGAEEIEDVLDRLDDGSDL